MKLAVALAAGVLAVTADFASAQQGNQVQGYTRQNGTYVQPHYQTAPDRNPNNNYTTQGNVNPYTGQSGTRDPNRVQDSYKSNSFGGSNSYGSGNQRRY